MNIQSTIEELRSRAEVQLPDFKLISDLMNEAANLLEHLFKQVAQKDEALKTVENFLQQDFVPDAPHVRKLVEQALSTDSTSE